MKADKRTSICMFGLVTACALAAFLVMGCSKGPSNLTADQLLAQLRAMDGAAPVANTATPLTPDEVVLLAEVGDAALERFYAQGGKSLVSESTPITPELTEKWLSMRRASVVFALKQKSIAPARVAALREGLARMVLDGGADGAQTWEKVRAEGHLAVETPRELLDGAENNLFMVMVQCGYYKPPIELERALVSQECLSDSEVAWVKWHGGDTALVGLHEGASWNEMAHFIMIGRFSKIGSLRPDEITRVFVLQHVPESRVNNWLTFPIKDAMVDWAEFRGQQFLRDKSKAPDFIPDFGMPPPKVASKDEVAPLEVIKRVPPTYPPAALAMGVSGKVTMECLVAEDGSVESVRVTDSPSPMLSDAATAAVKQWEFTPPKSKTGDSVRVWWLVNINFNTK